MIRFLKRVYSYVDNKIASFFMRLNSSELPADIPEDYYVNSLIAKVETILYNDSLSNAEKVNKLKSLIDGYDFLEY